MQKRRMGSERVGSHEVTLNVPELIQRLCDCVLGVVVLGVIALISRDLGQSSPKEVSKCCMLVRGELTRMALTCIVS